MISRRQIFTIGTAVAASGVLRADPRMGEVHDGVIETATMTWFNQAEGFGYIRGDDTGNDIYVDEKIMSESACGKLWRGDRIVVHWGFGPKGCMARSIARV